MTAVEQAGVIARPGDDGYEAACAVFNLAAPARPAAAITARTVADVRTALASAENEGLPVRVHSTGHASGATRPIDGGLLVRTRIAGGVTVDVSRRTARVPAGTPWGEVIEAATAHGLTAPHGSARTVGAVGYLLRGGMSFYGRAVGLGVNSVRAIELVTADGTLRRTSATEDAELFWALRGGGGGFGIVTAIEVALFPADRVITGGAYWAGEHTERLLGIWREWTLDAPRAATTSVRVLNLPDLPGVPPQLAGRTAFSVDGAILGDPADPAAADECAAALLAPLRAVAEPVIDTWAPTTPAAVLDAHMDPADPVPFHGDHMLLNELGSDGLAAFLEAAGPGSGSPFVVAGLRQLGGAFGEPAAGGGVLSHLDARYSYAGSGPPFFGVTVEALHAQVDRVRAALAPWDTGRTAPSFVESFDQPQGHLSPDQVAAVEAIRRRVDPDGVFAGDVSPNA